MANAKQGLYCYRCRRQRTREQLAVLFSIGGASKRYCVDAAECEEYQLQQKFGNQPEA